MDFRVDDIKETADTLWVSEQLLIEELKVKASYLRTHCRNRYKNALKNTKLSTLAIAPDLGIAWRWMKVNNTFYYDFDRIPLSTRTLLHTRQELLDGYEAFLRGRKRKTVYDSIKKALSNDWEHWINCYPGLPSATANGLAKACTVLEVTLGFIEKNNINLRKSELFVELGAVIDELSVPYLPKNWRRLKEKVMQALNLPDDQGLSDLIVPPRQGNNNAVKFQDEEIISWMFQLRSLGMNYTESHIIRKVQLACMMTAKPVPSESWFRAIFAKPDTKKLTASRYGSKGKKGANMREYIPLSTALFAGDCWQMDGTRINMIGHKANNGKIEYLYIIAVRDVHSGDVLGIHLDTKEDRWGYANALKMAVNETGYLPFELVTDRFPGHNTPEWENVCRQLKREGVKLTVTSSATGKARTERWFGTLQTVFMAESPYYYGEGIQSNRPYAHRTQEYIKGMSKKALKEGWDFDAAWRETVKVIGNYRETALNVYSRKYKDIGKSPRQLHVSSDKPHTRSIDPFRFVELFGMEKTVSIRNGGIIRTEIQRVEYVYNVAEYDTLMKYDTVRLCYDMEDLGRVYLFENSDDVNRAYLGEAHEQRAIQMYGPAADTEALGIAKKRIKQIQKRRQDDLQQITSTGDIEALLSSAYANKEEHGQAETAWLNEYADIWQDRKDQPRLTPTTSYTPDDDIEIDFDVRNMY